MPGGFEPDPVIEAYKRHIDRTLLRENLGEVTGGGRYEELLPHSIEVEIFGHRARCLDLAWLIRTKRAAGRPRDIEAIAELEALQEESGGRG